MKDHRRSSEEALVEALSQRDALALAEVVSRTLAVAYAVARRLLPAPEVEPVLARLYAHAWESAPSRPLERWVRAQTYALATAHLRASGIPPASPSVRAIEPDLPEGDIGYLDTTERMLSELHEGDRVALLRAHDQGVPASEQADDAAQHLVRGLLVLGQAEDETPWDDRLGDWILGLADPDTATELEQAARADATRDAVVRVLRRGRRRIEGLPPTPDLAPRLMAVTLVGATTGTAPPPSSLASADTGHDTGHDTAEIDEEDDSLLSVLHSDLDAGPPPVEPDVAEEELAREEGEIDEGAEEPPPRRRRSLARRILRFTIGLMLLTLGVGVGLFFGQFIGSALQ